MEKSLHILVLSSWYPTKEQPFLGNFVKRHVELIARKHKVTVLNLQSDPSVSVIEWRETNAGNLREVFVQYPAAGNLFSKWRNIRKAFKVGVQQIQGIDLIHGNVILSKGLQFIWAKKHFRKPLIVTEHASYFRKEISSKWFWIEKMTVQKVIRSADILTAVSPLLKSEIQVLFPEKPIEILPNVIDPDVFKYKLKQKHEITQFIHVSTLDERFKNISGILAACLLFKEELGTVFRMKIISDEPYEKWQSKVKEMKLDDCVFFSGPAQPSEIAAEIQHADAFILFSIYETFSIVVAEAWATGTPVISTPVGIAASMDEETGIQVETGNVEALKEALKTISEGRIVFDPEKIIQKAKEYSPEETLKWIDELYNRLMR